MSEEKQYLFSKPPHFLGKCVCLLICFQLNLTAAHFWDLTKKSRFHSALQRSQALPDPLPRVCDRLDSANQRQLQKIPGQKRKGVVILQMQL